MWMYLAVYTHDTVRPNYQREEVRKGEIKRCYSK